jgi:tRNA pseudouridine55 synthase
MDGILNLFKPSGMTSHDVVAQVRRLLRQRRVGHAGTLDPMAQGVLPICVGQATRVAKYLSESGKAYRATLIFGAVTDTYDAEGAIIHTANTDTLTREKLEEILPQFAGEQMQVPPRYSAIKLHGKPAYSRARAGEDITLEARPVTIYTLTLLNWQPPSAELLIECSKGTYIRSLAYDIGERVGYGAYLAALIRTRSGPFSLSESITLEQLAEAATSGTVSAYLYPADKALEQYPALHLDTQTAERVRHGNAFQHDQRGGTGMLARIYNESGTFLAIAQWNDQDERWQPIKVFSEGEASSGR